MQLWIINEHGYKVKPIKVDLDGEGNPLVDLENLVPAPCPDGLYRAKWNGTEWVEDMTQGGIDELYKKPPSDPSEIDIIKAQNKALSDRTEFLEDIIAEMAMKVYD